MSRNMDELRQMLKEEAEEKAIQEANEPATLLGRYFQEAEDDDEDEGENLEDIEKEMNDLDSDDEEDEDDELGKDDSDVQNEYDEGELNTLNELIADEQHAMQAYFKAGKETKSVILSRLYNDIGAEEAFHSEQLLYAKAELTGEKYEPSDPEVKKEYEELLENGMDEETAMYTVADRHKLDGGNHEDDMEELEDIEKDMEELGESFSMIISGMELMMAVQESGAYKNHAALREAYCEYYQNAEGAIFMEAMDNVATKEGSKILGTDNPFLIIGRAIKAVYMFIIDMVKKVKNWINKRRIKTKRAWEWLKKNGIKGLFADGVKLYFWNAETGELEVSSAVGYMKLCMNVTDWVAKAVGVQSPRVNNGKANGVALDNMNKNNIAFTSIQDGKHKIEGVVFSKSKVIVTDHNQSDLERMFFGYTDDKNTFLTSKDSYQTKDVKSMNIYNAFQYVLEWASEQLRATETWIEKTMTPAAGQQRGISYKKPEVWKQCVEAMKAVSKGYAKLIKCLNADIQSCMKLDQGLLAAVNEVDEVRSQNATTGTNAKLNVNPESRIFDSEGNTRVADKLQ